ncbi:MAG: SulP family inorganic anion transporter [bacterium]
MIDLLIKKQQSLKNDILSGLTVALALIPEAIAFSFVAHVDPRVGLYAAFMVGLITAVFGGRPGMISGATGAVAVIFAPLVIEQTAAFGMATALNALFVAVIIMGLLQCLFAFFRWGKFVRLIPHPVMFGFVNGLAIVIFKAQFSQFYVGSGASAQLISGMPMVVMLALIALTMAIIQFLPKLTTVVPATLVAIVSVTALAMGLQTAGFEIYTVLDFIQRMDPTKTTLAVGFPTFILPQISWSLIVTVFPYAFLAAAVGLIESLMTLTLVDELTDTRGRGNKESFGQGLANIINGFFGGMGGCAMIGQSMINIRAGGRGRLSGITAAVSLLIFILFTASLIEKIPLAALIGVMFMVSIATFEWSSVRLFKKIPRSDFVVIFLVSVTTVLVDLAVAVLVGIVVSALSFAWKQSRQIEHQRQQKQDGTTCYLLKGALFFGSCSTFKAIFEYKNDADRVTMDFTHARVCDHSGIEALQFVIQRYAKLQKKVNLINIGQDCAALLTQAEMDVEMQVSELKRWRVADDRLA